MADKLKFCCNELIIMTFDLISLFQIDNFKAINSDIFIFKDNFEATRFKEKMLVEKVGTQTQTSRKAPLDLNLRRIVLGPKLYFKADGTQDKDPIHYWG